MPRSTHSLFCDETGSTGSRFLDPQQPVFAEGGWFIAHAHKSAAMDAIVNIEKSYGFGATEPKGADLVKKPKGQALIREVCEKMGEVGGVPYIYVAEKRYAVCSKIVETLLDPLYNPAIPNSDTWDPEKRQTEAQFFYENGGALIEEFAEAYRLKKPGAVRANAEKWVEALRNSGHKDQAARVAGVLPNVEEEIETEARYDAAIKTPSGMDSLNMPIVAEVFQFVEQHCPFPCDIVHDQNASFEAVYKFVFDLYANASSAAALEMKDGRRIHYGFKNALSLSFADSKSQPLIRAADYALAGARKFIQLATAGEPISENVTWIAFATLGAILLQAYAQVHPSLDRQPKLSGYMSSNYWRDMVFGRLSRELSDLMPCKAREAD
ncbi:MAG TPA: DUF3800 domain-containing protein [Bradyrhizobium sp.]|nr:DUF3800 domain-containing protein [Bradyrhizobium sp.]